jgi:hypothetical protein
MKKRGGSVDLLELNWRFETGFFGGTWILSLLLIFCGKLHSETENKSVLPPLSSSPVQIPFDPSSSLLDLSVIAWFVTSVADSRLNCRDSKFGDDDSCKNH